MSVEDNLSQDLAEARFRQLEVPHMRVHLDISDKRPIPSMDGLNLI